MINICLTLHEGQGQYNEHVMHSHVWGSHSANVDDDDDLRLWKPKLQAWNVNVFFNKTDNLTSTLYRE